MSYIKLALLLLKLVSNLMTMAERRGHINEGRRRQVADELVAIAKTTKLVGKEREEDEKATDEEIFRDLMS